MKRLLIAATALSLIGATAASAQPYRDRDHDGVPNRYDRHDDRGPRGDRDHDGVPNRYDRHDNRYRAERRDNRFFYGGRYYDRYRGPAFIYPRGYSYRPWARGQYLPRAYFAPRYYVEDWRHYGLRPPPRGYRYVRVGNDIVLAAIAGGLIAEVVNGVFY